MRVYYVTAVSTSAPFDPDGKSVRHDVFKCFTREDADAHAADARILSPKHWRHSEVEERDEDDSLQHPAHAELMNRK